MYVKGLFPSDFTLNYTTSVQHMLQQLPNRIFQEKLLRSHWDHKNKWIAIKNGNVNFFRGAERGEVFRRYSLQHSFVLCPIHCATKGKSLYKMYSRQNIHRPEGSVQPEVLCWAYRSVQSARREPTWRATVCQKNENGKKWPNFKTSVLANYRSKFKLLFTILNLSMSTFILS